METTSANTQSLEKINERIKMRQINAKLEIENKINRMRDYELTMNMLESKMEHQLPNIVAALNSVGLGSFCRNGCDRMGC